MAQIQGPEATAPPPYPLSPSEMPSPGSVQHLYPTLNDYMGLDLSPEVLAANMPEYAVAIPSPVNITYFF